MIRKFAAGAVALALLLMAATTAHAWWYANARVTVRPSYVEAAAYNRFSVPIHCSGYVYGRTASGNVIQNYSAGTVAPYGYGFIFVSAHGYDRFVNGWAEIRCRR